LTGSCIYWAGTLDAPPAKELEDAMDQPLKLTTIVGNPKAGSRTLAIAVEVAEQVARWFEGRGAMVQSEQLDLAELSSGMFDWENQTIDEAVERTIAADVLVVASPTYKATYTGLLKAFLDRFPSNALQGHIAIPIMVGAAPIHALAVETHLRPLLIELGASCPTRGLYVLESQLPELEAVVGRWLASAVPALGAVRWHLELSQAGS
jgi:FMN reductase